MSDTLPIAGEPVTVSVSQVTRRLALTIKNDKSLRDVYVAGEIFDFTFHRASGHCYFTLRDEAASVRAVMFSSYAKELDFSPQDGMQVRVRCSVDVYERDGTNRLYVNAMQTGGAGNLLLLYKELKDRLEAEGVFAQKRPLPPYPECLCIITSPEGAALYDMLRILSERWPVARVIFIPARVQGAQAPDSIIAALQKAQQTDAEIILFGRGGGSSEDLSAFNHEGVVRAVYASRIPTVSGTGHETDFTLCDYAADFRAPTPTAAMQLAVPDGRELLLLLDNYAKKMYDIADRICRAKLDGVSVIGRLLAARTPQARLNQSEQQLEYLIHNIQRSMARLLEQKTGRLNAVSAMVRALDPMNILGRGYAAVSIEGGFVTDAAQLAVGQRVSVRLASGRFAALVEEIQPDEKEAGKP